MEPLHNYGEYEAAKRQLPAMQFDAEKPDAPEWVNQGFAEQCFKIWVFEKKNGLIFTKIW